MDEAAQPDTEPSIAYDPAQFIPVFDGLTYSGGAWIGRWFGGARADITSIEAALGKVDYIRKNRRGGGMIGFWLDDRRRAALKKTGFA